MAELNEIIEVLSGLQRLAIAEILAAERTADLPKQNYTGPRSQAIGIYQTTSRTKNQAYNQAEQEKNCMSVIHGDALSTLKKFKSKIVDLTFIDPPFNAGKPQRLLSSGASYNDSYNDFESFLKPILAEVDRVTRGSIFVLLDYREIHYSKVWLDQIMGRESFKGEIIWFFETGGQSKSRWSNKHNTILWFSRKQSPTFNYDKVPTESRKAPKDSYTSDKKWSSVWNINMSTTDPQRVGYPSQKPEKLLETIIEVHSDEGQTVLDCFAGSGTTGAVAKRLGRKFCLVDSSADAIKTINKRIGGKS